MHKSKRLRFELCDKEYTHKYNERDEENRSLNVATKRKQNKYTYKISRNGCVCIKLLLLYYYGGNGVWIVHVIFRCAYMKCICKLLPGNDTYNISISHMPSCTQQHTPINYDVCHHICTLITIRNVTHNELKHHRICMYMYGGTKVTKQQKHYTHVLKWMGNALVVKIIMYIVPDNADDGLIWLQFREIYLY